MNKCMQAHKKLFEKRGGGGGGADFAPGSYAVIFFLLKILGKFFRHGVGLPSYMTNLYNKQAKNEEKNK